MRQKQQAGSKTSKKVNNPGSYTGKATETIKCSEMGIMGDGVRGDKVNTQVREPSGDEWEEPKRLDS